MHVIIKDIDGNDPDVRTFIRELLNAKRVAITFLKLNGQIRTIDGSTRQDIVPANKWEEYRRRSFVPTTCTIWDIHLNDWRCFRWDRIMEISIHSSFSD